MKALVSRIQDESDHDAQKYFGEYPSLRTHLSYGGYTAEAAALDKDIFSPFSAGSSSSTFSNMTLNFGTEDMVDAFPALPAPAPPQNPWKQTTPENQLAVRGDDRSTVSMTDASFATTLKSVQSDMASLLSGTIAAIQQDNAKERRASEEREANREVQRQEREATRETQRNQERSDDLRRLAKVEERNESTQTALLQLMQQMAQQSGQVMMSVPPAAGTTQQALSTEITPAMIEAMNGVTLAAQSPSAKKVKVNDMMDHHDDHPQLQGPPTTDTNRNLPPGGGGH